VTGVILGLTQSGLLFQLSTFLTGVQGRNDVGSALALLPFALGTLVASLATGVVLSRRFAADATDPGVLAAPIVAGLVLVALAMVVFASLRPDSGYPAVGLGLAMVGVGASVANVPRTDLLSRSVREGHTGVAAGLNGSCFLLGQALGAVCVTVTIAVSSASEWQARMIAEGLSADEAQRLYQTIERVIFVVTAHPFVHSSYVGIASGAPGFAEVFTDGFTAAMATLSVVALAGAVVAWVGLRAESPPPA
jgi:DHA2 family multidrug resistance protein-like MFS transporter